MPTIHIRVSDELLTAIDAAAAADGRTRAAMGALLLAEALGVPRISNGKVQKASVPDLIKSGAVTTADKIETVVTATKAIQRGLPKGLCGHGRDPKFCTIGECAMGRGK